LSSELVVERVNVDLSVLEELPEIPVVLRLSIDESLFVERGLTASDDHPHLGRPVG
jgi:hypothetical protein